MSNIETIIVDGVRYDRVQAKSEFVCEECELRDKCQVYPVVALQCRSLAKDCECWERKE